MAYVYTRNTCTTLQGVSSTGNGILQERDKQDAKPTRAVFLGDYGLWHLFSLGEPVAPLG